MNVRGLIVFLFTFSLDLVDRGVTVCSFTGLDLAERGVIVCSFIFPDPVPKGPEK